MSDLHSRTPIDLDALQRAFGSLPPDERTKLVAPLLHGLAELDAIPGDPAARFAELSERLGETEGSLRASIERLQGSPLESDRANARYLQDFLDANIPKPAAPHAPTPA